MSEILLKGEGLKKYFPIRSGMFSRGTGGVVHAVDGVDLCIKRGETLGLVGESGCGKTTLGYLILGIIKPTAGEVYFEGRRISKLNKGELNKTRKKIQIVFQDPQSSLDPRMTVSRLVDEPLRIFKLYRGEERKEIVSELLEDVGLRQEHMQRYPHELSGGEKQRVVIARALVLRPKLIVLDEPTSALDVSVQAKILNLIQNIKKAFGLSYLFVSHDLSVVRNISERIAVMYLGKMVEIGDAEKLFQSPLHPYTKALLSAVPDPNPRKRLLYENIILTGEVPSPVNIPSGCRFHTRCAHVSDICKKAEPELIEVGHEHFVACHLVS